MKPKMSFAEILGETREQYTDEERKRRWEEWQNCATTKRHKEMVEYWNSTEGCERCKHLNNHWCESAGLPTSVNPILSFRMGMIGMACMGAGYEAKEPQLELFA